MELNGPSVCEVAQRLEYSLKNIHEALIVHLLDPNNYEISVEILETKNPTEKRIEIHPLSVGVYCISVYDSHQSNLLGRREFFCYNLAIERCHFEELHGSLDNVHIVMEIKMHQPVKKLISAQAHLTTQYSGPKEQYNVIQCNVDNSFEWTSNFSFKPPQYGSYEIFFFCGHKSMTNPRFSIHVVDYSKFKLVHSFTTDRCLTSIKQKVSFIFDLSGAPSNYLQAWVEGPDNVRVDILLYGEEKEEKIGQLRCDFLPNIIGNHSLFAYYGDEVFEKCPLLFQVFNEDMVTVVSMSPITPDDLKVGGTLCITYDCSQCGPGQLTISPNMQLGSGVKSLLSSKTNGADNRGFIAFIISLSQPGRCVVDALYNNQICKGVSLVLTVHGPPEKELPRPPTKNNTIAEKVVHKDKIKPEIPIKVTRYPKKSPDRKKATKRSSGSDKTSKPKTSEPVASGDGLLHAVVGEVSTFTFDPKDEAGQLLIDVQGPKSIAKCLIRPDSKSGRYNVEYYPREVGLYMISIMWNEKPIPSSPFQVTVTSNIRIRCINYPDIFEKILLMSKGQSIPLSFDCSDAGIGKLSAILIKEGSEISLECWSDEIAKVWSFLVEPLESEEVCQVDVLWNGAAVGVIQIEYKVFNDMATSSTSQTIDHTLQIVLKGRGIKEAWQDEPTEFIVNATNAGEGSLIIKLSDDKVVVPVKIRNLVQRSYLCQYTPNYPGNYWLNIQWGSKTLKGSPFPVKVWNFEPSRQVHCQGEALLRGFVGEENYIQITIRSLKRTGYLLSVSCLAPNGESVICNLEEESSFQYQLSFVALQQGKYQLNILYGGRHVPGSPFHPMFSVLGNVSNIVVTGPGLSSGRLDQVDSRFTVDTTEAGRGKLTVQVKGPQESFHVEVQKDSDDERIIRCSYNPTVAGQYTINICWDGILTNDSPYEIVLS